jgi:2EXR family
VNSLDVLKQCVEVRAQPQKYYQDLRRIEGHYYLIIFQNILLESYRQDRADAEFHFFPRLLAELRLKVWTFARPAPRLIHAQIKTGYELHFSLPGEVCLLVPHLAILGRKAPSVLQVCKESRALLPPDVHD